MQGDPPFWAPIAIAAGVTVVLGAVVLLVITVAILSTSWLRRKWRRREG